MHIGGLDVLRGKATPSKTFLLSRVAKQKKELPPTNKKLKFAKFGANR